MALDPLTAIIDFGGKLLDKFIADPQQKAQAQLELIKMQQSGELAAMVAQTDINMVEAASNNWFVAGWRPAIGWVGAMALAYKFIVYPSLCWGIAFFPHMQLPPAPNADELYPIIMGMLGIGALRSFDKLKGTDTK